MNKLLTIGKLAKVSDVGVETIRFYHRKGLLAEPATRNGAFRVYPDVYVSKIRFIKKAQQLGFTLAEIKDLLLLDQNKNATCKSVALKAQAKVEEVKAKIDGLRKMEQALMKIIVACGQGPQAKACCQVSDCFDKNVEP
ncbi:MAG: MerR family DNA-binding protein [Deltaproteobacteria bacterium]|nr:MerR family DNA-binding protein [Deltaproteobacteria bacterium]